MSEVVRVKMLGQFSLSAGDVQIDDSQNRSRKVWALLAILLCNHGRTVTQNELIELLWDNDREDANPANTLKTTLHRARGILAPLLSDAEGAQLIVSAKGGYAWNNDIPLWLDIEEFETLCRPPAQDEEDGGLARMEAALALYQGPFLNKLSGEAYVIPRAAYYHNLYTETVSRALELMEIHGRAAEAAELSREALRMDPYQEDLYQHLMRNLLALGEQQQAAAVYEDMNRLLLSNFGVMPDQESRRLYREALRTVNRWTVPADIILDQLRESDPVQGALICDYDFFKMIYQAEARMVARSGSAVHIALLSVSGADGKELPRRSIEPAMDNLEQLLFAGLRKGDVIARCSPSQFVIMLPQANYENSCMVCQRIIRSFTRRYPHSPAVIEPTVYPLEPTVRIDMNFTPAE